MTSLPVGFPIDIWCILKLQTLKSGEYFAGDFWGVQKNPLEIDTAACPQSKKVSLELVQEYLSRNIFNRNGACLASVFFLTCKSVHRMTWLAISNKL